MMDIQKEDSEATADEHLETEDLQDIINLHKIESLPTLVFYKNGELQQHSIIGYNSKEEIKQYFSINIVLNGLFNICKKIYGFKIEDS